jgi:hypothetical protein
MFRVLISAAVVVLALAACGGEETGAETTAAPAPTTATTDSDATTAPAPEDGPGDDVFTPSVPLPFDFPVFPGAVLWNEFPAGTGHNYLYNTSGTAEEIVEFFAIAFHDLGIEVTGVSAIHEEFFVYAALPGSDVGVSIYFLDDGLDDVTPSTPGRGYGVNIDLEAWATQ